MTPASFLHYVRWLPVIACILVASLAVVSAPDVRSTANAAVPTAASAETKPAGLVICEVFGDRHCAQALRVVWCESRFDTNARNGQYRGLFQVSAHWRRTVPGFGPTVRQQARHAHRVFRKTGSHWGHWSCRP